MLKKIIVILFLSLLSINAKATIFPPYPEIWGYDLSALPAIKSGSASLSAYPMKDGDVWFLVTHSYKIKPSLDSSEKYTNKKYLLIKFFKNEKIELSEKERIKLYKIIEKEGDTTPYHYDQDFNFSDGSKVKLDTTCRGARRFLCPDLYTFYFLKTSQQDEEKKYMVLAVQPQVEMWIDG